MRMHGTPIYVWKNGKVVAENRERLPLREMEQFKFCEECMAHHKRKRPKNQRAGCLMCKPWKMNGFGQNRLDAESSSDHRRRRVADNEVKEFWQNLWGQLNSL
jgi:hypothetical protein